MKRTVSWSVDGFHWNADNSHGEKVVRYCFPDMQEATRRLTSPGSNHIGKSARDAAEELVDEKRDEYRSMARTDLQYTKSVFMRNVETSLKLQEMQLMRRANYISAVREWRWDFQHQEMPDEVYVEVDSDWAQCPRTCRSTGAGLVFWRKHLLASYCQQQHTISLASAEAELHEVVNGAARGLFIRNVLQSMEL